MQTPRVRAPPCAQDRRHLAHVRRPRCRPLRRPVQTVRAAQHDDRHPRLRPLTGLDDVHHRDGLPVHDGAAAARVRRDAGRDQLDELRLRVGRRRQAVRGDAGRRHRHAVGRRLPQLRLDGPGARRPLPDLDARRLGQRH
eukprot:4334341-Prymnesium_polylepis.1